jgi:glycosyltransferase involved in cell wall biosynthesis
LGIPSERLVLGVVGRLNPVKAQDRFVESLEILRSGGYNVHGLIVGGTSYGLAPDYPALVERRVRDLGLENVVTFTGQVEDAGPYIELMDVLVNACAIESFGIAIVEAMARGVPVVAVGADGPSEIIEQGLSGVLVDGGEPRQIADGIASLLNSEDLRRSLGDGGRRRFEEHFTCERMARELEDILLDLVSRREANTDAG